MKGKKFIAMFGLLMLVILSVRALTEHQVLTQTQLDSMETATEDLNAKFVRNPDSSLYYNCTGMNRCHLKLTYLTLYRWQIPEGYNYTSINRTLKIFFKPAYYLNLVSLYGMNYAASELQGRINNISYWNMNSTRRLFSRFQTKVPEDVDSLVSNLDLP